MSYLIDGFSNLISSGGWIYLMIGIIAGVIIGSLPGLTGTMGMSLLLPFTYSLPSSTGLSLLIGIFAGAIYGGSISAILLRTPGTPAAGATLIDGYPMAKRGEAGRALATATIASALGGLIGALILTFLAPSIAKIALKFGAPEYIWLAVYGLTMISFVSGKSLIKGYIAGLVGLLLATIGIDPISGSIRFTFGSINLISGVSLQAVLIGLFAMAQALSSVEEYDQPQAKQLKISRVGISAADFIKILPHVVKSALIGTFVGAVPGTGTDIAAFLSYGEAKRSSKNPEEFGKGAIEGIAAPESGNNACVNGALIPMFTLGIPGEAGTAVLLGGLMVLGLTPGPLLFRDHPETIYTVFASTITSNLFIIIFGLLCARLFAKVLSLPKNMITVIIFVLALTGSFSMRNNVFDVLTTVVAGIIGYFMTKADYPVAPVLLGIILGPTVEQNLSRALLISGGKYTILFTRPISIIFIVIIVATLLSNFNKQRKNKKSKNDLIAEEVAAEAAAVISEDP
jgi:putative tricarboxylic transport membrane protein